MPVIIIFLGFLFFVGICFLSAYLFDSAFGGLDFVSNRAARVVAVNIIKQRNLASGIFYDLGSARGKLAAGLAKDLPELNIIGIDNSRLRTLVAKSRSKFLKNLHFRKENLFQTNVSAADIVYVYLPQELMPDLEVKLQKELKPGSIVITNRVSFPSWKETEKNQQLFIYAKE